MDTSSFSSPMEPSRELLLSLFEWGIPLQSTRRPNLGESLSAAESTGGGILPRNVVPVRQKDFWVGVDSGALYF